MPEIHEVEDDATGEITAYIITDDNGNSILLTKEQMRVLLSMRLFM